MSNTSDNSNKDNTKLTLILIYVFWIVGLILHFQNKTKIGAFHLRQVIGLCVCAIVAQVVLTILAIVLGSIASILATIISLLSLVVMIGCLVCWIIGLLGAIKGEEKLMPIVGPLSQKFLGHAFE